MKSGVVIDLVQAHYSHSEDDFRKIVNSLIDEEFAKGNRSLAVSLQRAMVDTNRHLRKLVAPPDSDDDFMPSLPKASLDDVVLTPKVHSSILGVIEEQAHKEELESRHVDPTSRILLQGPPGCGKTMVAHAIADALGKTIMVVDFGTLISSLMGESGSNISRLFRKAAATGSVLFIDEVDAIGRTRGDDHDNGEAKRIVISLLQNLDNAPSDLMIVAATNMFSMLDGAVVRRFQKIVEIDIPTDEQRAEIIAKYFERHPHDGGYELSSLNTIMAGASGSEVRNSLDGMSRRAVVEGYHGPIDGRYCVQTYLGTCPDKPIDRLEFYKMLRKLYERGIGYSELSRLTDIPYSTLYRNIKKAGSHDE